MNAEKINKEIQTVREDFLKEAELLLQQRKSELETKLKEQYETKLKQVDEAYANLFYEKDEKLKEKTKEAELAHRITNIQAVILYEIFVKDPALVHEVLQAKNISEKDLQTLATQSTD